MLWFGGAWPHDTCNETSIATLFQDSPERALGRSAVVLQGGAVSRLLFPCAAFRCQIPPGGAARAKIGCGEGGTGTRGLLRAQAIAPMAGAAVAWAPRNSPDRPVFLRALRLILGPPSVGRPIALRQKANLLDPGHDASRQDLHQPALYDVRNEKCRSFLSVPAIDQYLEFCTLPCGAERLLNLIEHQEVMCPCFTENTAPLRSLPVKLISSFAEKILQNPVPSSDIACPTLPVDDEIMCENRCHLSLAGPSRPMEHNYGPRQFDSLAHLQEDAFEDTLHLDSFLRRRSSVSLGKAPTARDFHRTSLVEREQSSRGCFLCPGGRNLSRAAHFLPHGIHPTRYT